MKRFPVIVGPTAGGKSALGVEVSMRIGSGGEVVSADSMQVYRGMDVGTAKPTSDERAGVVHHLIDVREPEQPFSVDEWLGMAEGAISDVRTRGKTPVVVGGTLLYAKTLLEGLFEGPASDPALRAALNAMDPHERRAELERIDPSAAARIHFNDVRRTVRALEVYRLTGRPISVQQQEWDAGRVRADALLVGLEWPTEEINRRINSRVRQMVDRGLVEEVRELWSKGRLGPQAREALGYKQLIAAFERGGGTVVVGEAIEQIKVETRRFAKNQRTWLRRLRTTPGSVWIDAATIPRERWASLVLDRLGV